MPIWLALKLLKPFVVPALLGASLLLAGQALGLPIAETIATALWEGASALFWWAVDGVLSWLESLVYDRLNPFN